MHKKLTKIIEKLLDEGMEKIYIERTLSEDFDKIDYKFILANYPEARYKKRFKAFNHFLIIMVGVFALLKMHSFFFLTQNLHIALSVLSLVLVAAIAIVIYKHVIKFKRSGYLMLIMAALFGLYQPLVNLDWTFSSGINNESLIVYLDIIISIFIIFSSSYLVKKIFRSFMH